MTVKDYFYTNAYNRGMSIREYAENVLQVNYHTFYTQMQRNEGMGLPASTLCTYLERAGGQALLLTDREEFVLDGETEDYAYGGDE